jgi:hypothetical protein
MFADWERGDRDSWDFALAEGKWGCRISTGWTRIRGSLAEVQSVKIGCQCGATIYGGTDYLPHKAHFIPDQDWFDVLEAIDAAIEKSGPGAKEKEAACMEVRGLIGRLSRLAWQCRACGRVYLADQTHQLRPLVSATDDVPRELFRSRPSTE